MTLEEAAGRLEEVACARGVAWPQGSALRLARYLAEVVRMSEEVNLTGAADLGAALQVLGIPSLALGGAGPYEPAPQTVVDLGSGNGMPGVVAALAWPTARVLLVERRAKKAYASLACARAVDLENVEALALDGRELLGAHPKLRGAVDLVLARGVGSLEDVTRMAGPWLARGARLLHWKAADLGADERRAGERAARGANLLLVPDVVYDPPRPGPGRLVIYRRKA